MKCRQRKIVRAKAQTDKAGRDESKLMKHNVERRIHVKEIYGTVLLVRQRDGKSKTEQVCGEMKQGFQREKSNDHQKGFLFLRRHCP